MASTTSIIKGIAKKVRRWGEKNAFHYGSDQEDLSCMCAITAYEIVTALRAKGIDAKFCTNRYHAFAMVDNKVIDVTASQFNSKLPKIMIGNASNFPSVSFDGVNIWSVKGRAVTPKGIKSLLKEWPSNQQPMVFRNS
jgi:hypothetical protein